MKKLICALLAGILFFAFSVPAFAESDSCIFDAAQLLSAQQVSMLEAKAQAVFNLHQCGVYLITVEDYQEYSTYSAEDAAQNLYENLGLGYGSDADGILLFLSMADRDYALIAHGDLGNEVFTDDAKDALENSFLDDLARNNWYSGFLDYVSGCEEILRNPADYGDDYNYGYGDPSRSQRSFGSTAVTSLLIALIPAGIMALIDRSSVLNRVRKSDNAYRYMARMDITGRNDNYLRSSMTATRIAQSNPGVRPGSRPDGMGGTVSVRPGNRPGNRPGGMGGAASVRPGNNRPSVNSHGFSSHSGKF